MARAGCIAQDEHGSPETLWDLGGRAGIFSLTVGLVLFLAGSALAEPADPYPLEPPDTSSPRATVMGFLDNMEQAHRLWSETRSAYYKESGLYPSEALQERGAGIAIKARRAGRYLNLSEIPPSLLRESKIQAIILLKEILDRIEIPSPASIPDADQMDAEQLTRWRIPHTNLAITKVKDGPQSGEYLFTPTTVERLEEFYERVKHLPYKPGSWEGVYELYLASPNWTAVPLKLVDRLPLWTKKLVWDNPIWQWLLLGVVLLGTMILVALGYLLRRHRLGETIIGSYARRLLLPLIIMGASVLVALSVDRIGITGDPYQVLAAALTAIFYFAAAWAFMAAGLLLGEAIVSSPHISSRGVDAALIRLTTRFFAFVIAAFILVYGLGRIGVPVVPLLAGLGVGGIALALAAQPTIENLIAGVTLFADRPVRVGDMCQFGDKFGTVEEIGMRSTRVRTFEDTLLIVPNAQFSKLELENFTARKKSWYHPRIRLRYETTPDQIRYILVEVRKLLYSHPKVHQDQARIRFTQFGEYSLDLDIFAYVKATTFPAYFEITEDLNLRIMDVVAKAGTGLAIPVRRSYTEPGQTQDEARTRAAEEQVKAWKEENKLYLPSFPKEKIAELADSLDYPPAGSPDASSSQKKAST